MKRLINLYNFPIYFDSTRNQILFTKPIEIVTKMMPGMHQKTVYDCVQCGQWSESKLFWFALKI